MQVKTKIQFKFINPVMHHTTVFSDCRLYFNKLKSIAIIHRINEENVKKGIETCRNLGVWHYDLKLSPKKAPSPGRIQELLRLFRIAPRPVLIHCKAGADRAGLAAALWKMVIDGAPQSKARRHLSIRYGHMPLGPTQALDEFLENWEIPTKAKMDAEKMTF